MVDIIQNTSDDSFPEESTLRSILSATQKDLDFQSTLPEFSKPLEKPLVETEEIEL